MSESVNPRISLLAEELKRAASELTERSSTRSAVVFLDRFARLRRYALEDIAAAGETETIRLAESVQASIGDELGTLAAEGLDVASLVDQAQAIVSGESSEVMAWGFDALVVAEVEPMLPRAGRASVREALVEGFSWVETAPRSFIALTSLAADRIDHEVAPTVADSLVNQALRLFSETPLLAAEMELSREPAPELVAELDRIWAAAGLSDASAKVIDFAEWASALKTSKVAQAAKERGAQWLTSCENLILGLERAREGQLRLAADDQAWEEVDITHPIWVDGESELHLILRERAFQVVFLGSQSSSPMALRLDNQPLVAAPDVVRGEAAYPAWQLPPRPSGRTLWLEMAEGVVSVEVQLL